MKNRILVAALLLGTVLPGFFWEPARALAVVLLTVLAVICIYELHDMFRPRGTYISRRVAVAIVAGLALLNWGGASEYGYLVLGLGACLAFAWRMRRPPLEGSFRDISATIAAFMYVGLPMAVLIELFVLSDATRAWLLYMCTLAWLGDTGAMLVGKRFGRVKLIPRLSPGKTVEGAIGGVGGALVAAAIARTVASETMGNVTWPEMIVMAVAFSIVAQVGDLSESLLKRDAGVKDSGRSLGAHGGALDRIDSILFLTIPFSLYLRVFHPEAYL